MARFEYPRYSFRRPPELDERGGRRTVAIVGAGPVGLCAALELARHGLQVLVLDPRASVAEGSRAICIARRSLEILQQVGAVAPFVAKGLAWTHGSSYYRGRLVYRLEMPHGSDERYAPMTNLQQQYIERFLVEKVLTVPAIDLRFHSTVTAVEPRAAGVRLTVSTAAGQYALDADWVVAADGARSTVRELLGLKLEGEAYEGRYLIADIHMHMDYPTERRAFFDPPANPGGTVLVHKQPDDIWRIDYQLRDDEDAQAELAEARVRARLDRIVAMLGAQGPWTLEWWSLYRAYTLALRDYRQGRVLFAGDAAHLVPIFGVRGLNSGFADANNLGWKLALVVRGLAPQQLLDSYTPERRAATLDAFAHAGKSTRFMTPPTRGFRLLRQAALELALTHEFTRALINPRQSTPYDYVDSPLSSHHETCARFSTGPRAGAAACNVRLGADDYLLDHLDNGFTGLLFGPVAADVRNHLARILAGVGTVIDVDPRATTATGRTVPDAGGHVADVYGATAGSFYLLRPDGHVCARWRHVDVAQVGDALAMALGRAAA
ncbi:MAG: FAD-dependent oxidoreductase [Gammaproteobacteria bacterium]|nr:FAD-dependent oxidoreductase [Gammaproteobacteria bacterium]